MSDLLTAAQMRVLERDAIDSGNVTGLELMERAGRGVVDAVLAEWPQFATGAHRALVLCGPGNNGGDGFVIARRLQARGWDVDVWLYGDGTKLPVDARRNHDVWCGIGTIQTWDSAAILSGPRPDLIVDAVFGIGLTRPLPEAVAQVLTVGRFQSWGDGPTVFAVAVDCPSGLNLDSGMVPQGDATEGTAGAMNAVDLTVTFHGAKPGHYLGSGPGLCGAVRVVDIGLAGDAQGGAGRDGGRIRHVTRDSMPSPNWPLDLISKTRRGGHKFDHGHVMVFAGGVGRGGAGRLAARAALRSGAGLVTLLCPPAALQENACQLNAIMLRAVRGPEALEDVADERVSAFCLGPGMGVSDRTRDMVQAVLARRDPVVVLDADALSSFAGDPATLFAATHERVVLTPHEGEFARLFPDLAAGVRGELSKVDVVRMAAARAGCIVLLKGADTVIAGPDGGASIHAAVYGRSVPWLATAGAGDVLAGLIAGLAAPQDAGDLRDLVEVAVWLHVECARSLGPGLIAEDLPEELPKVLRALGA
ncbi:NAD(P)H-hydrate dehydratase [Puniceibacterium sediminis]|uniref:Bifunctional NAD(P)H-hydrate repair enzyme n=1 Tax=Puniceibacterium sediminis TaxID=1608407 RepID=A0A238XRP3_9RHOB|nr:NAD(P)H-hydrate dehydratase [Puniceibacterium sediminis]SNR61238.1 yjeF C-terminal region, hydroxyethylthiazole kinase-related/yjeF N-terminal region [Puniceibacterium sediminis]